MAKLRALLILMAIIAIATSCEEKTGSEAFLAPTIVSANANAGIASVTFSCTLSAPRAQECGFVYWSEKDSEKTILCELQGASFEASVSGLSSERIYHWYAFAKTGASEVRSDTGMFSTMEIPPPPTPPEVMIDIPDKVFKEYLIAHYDTDGDGEISESEALKVRKIAVKTDNILSLEGIEYFTNLDSLICRGVDLDMDEHAEIGTPGRLTSLDLSKNIFLSHLECDGNHLKSLILPDNPWMVFLRCSHNYLTELDLSKLSGLEVLKAFNNQLTAIDVSYNPFLRTIELHNNFIESIDVTNCPLVDCLNIGNNKVKEVDLSKCPNLYWLGVFRTGITSVDLSACTNLHYLCCYESAIPSLDLTPCLSLYELRCYDCIIKELDISMLPNLEIVDCAPMNSLTTLYVSDVQHIEGVTHNRSEENLPARTEIVVRYTGAPEGRVDVKDPVFKAYLLSNFDRNGDGEISNAEALRVTTIEVTTENITSLKGIERCSNLEKLFCPGGIVDYETDDYGDTHEIRKGLLTELDLTNFPKLTELGCQWNQIEVLDLSANTKLLELIADNNRLKSVDLSHNPNISSLCLQGNQLTEITDISNLPLKYLHMSGLEMIKHMNPDFLTNFPNLISFNISNYEGETLDLSKNTEVDAVWCWNMSNLKVLDLSGMPKLGELYCGSWTGHTPEKVIVHKDIDISKLKIRKSKGTVVVNAE
ncbi:MAG: hypothetical protein IJK19_02660 [Bacteroidales bacterium]|nr:hypothetical protein [Bacteroidales bacterium]